MQSYYLGIDHGTTLTTAVLLRTDGTVAAKASVAHKQYFPQSGWVEHDPMEVYHNCLAATRLALQEIGAAPKELLGVGMDHQGESCLIWDKKTGEPIYNTIVWQDRRTADIAEQLRTAHGEMIHGITGVLPDAYHSATKLMWLLEHIDGARERLSRGELMLGTLNTWLFWKFSGGTCYKTDPSSASCMMLMDLHTTDWCDELLQLAGLTREQLPEICDCNTVYGDTAPGSFLGVSIPMAGSCTDSPAGLLGGGCLEPGVLKTSYGTGSFMSMLTGEKIVLSDNGLFTSCVWRMSGTPCYRLYGSSYVAGAAVEWLKNGLGIIDDPRQTEQMALSVPDCNDLYFVPAFHGLATPDWDPYARGLLIGLTAGVTREHIVRAVLEALAFQVANNYRIMREVSGQSSSVMRADGGMVENRFLMQFQADLLGIPVEVPEEKEAAAFGAACLAAYTLGGISDLAAIKPLVKLKKTYEPKMSADKRQERLTRWLDAVDRSRGWAN